MVPGTCDSISVEPSGTRARRVEASPQDRCHSAAVHNNLASALLQLFRNGQIIIVGRISITMSPVASEKILNSSTRPTFFPSMFIALFGEGVQDAVKVPEPNQTNKHAYRLLSCAKIHL